MEAQFAGIYARKHAIVEAMLGLKHKIVVEVMNMRVQKIYQPKMPDLEEQDAKA